MDLTRRKMFSGSAAIAGGLAGVALLNNTTPAFAAGSTTLPSNKLVWSTYGDWLKQIDETMVGRYDSMQVRNVPGSSNTWELWCRWDRAEVDAWRQNGITDEKLLALTAWKGTAWCSNYNTSCKGLWEVDVQMPARAGIGFALMLWPKDDNQWPYGEINIAEGQTGTGKIMTNLHWGTLDNKQHDPAYINLDTSVKHRYGVNVQNGRIDYYVDRKLIRTLYNSQVPYGNLEHLVLQIGADKNSIPQPPYASDFYFEEKFTITPITMP